MDMGVIVPRFCFHIGCHFVRGRRISEDFLGRSQCVSRLLGFLLSGRQSLRGRFFVRIRCGFVFRLRRRLGDAVPGDPVAT